MPLEMGSELQGRPDERTGRSGQSGYVCSDTAVGTYSYIRWQSTVGSSSLQTLPPARKGKGPITEGSEGLQHARTAGSRDREWRNRSLLTCRTVRDGGLSEIP